MPQEKAARRLGGKEPWTQRLGAVTPRLHDLQQVTVAAPLGPQLLLQEGNDTAPSLLSRCHHEDEWKSEPWTQHALRKVLFPDEANLTS